MKGQHVVLPFLFYNSCVDLSKDLYLFNMNERNHTIFLFVLRVKTSIAFILK